MKNLKMALILNVIVVPGIFPAFQVAALVAQYYVGLITGFDCLSSHNVVFDPERTKTGIDIVDALVIARCDTACISGSPC